MKVIQTAIFLLIAVGNIYFQVTDNGYAASLIGFFAVMVFTVFPVWLYERWKLRNLRARLKFEAKRRGLIVGWQRHLPWNARKKGYSWGSFKAQFGDNITFDEAVKVRRRPPPLRNADDDFGIRTKISSKRAED